MSGSLTKLRIPKGSEKRVRLLKYSTLLGRQRPPSFLKGQGLGQFKIPEIPTTTTNWWSSWWGGGGGGSAPLKSVYIGETPDPHIDHECLRDLIEGYLTVHYYNASYEAMTGGDPSHDTEVNWQVNNEKLPGMTGGSRCTAFGRDLASFEIDNWDTVCEIVGEIFNNERLFNLISLFKGEKHQGPSEAAKALARE